MLAISPVVFCPKFAAKANANQAIATATPTKVLFPTILFNVGGFFAGSTFTPPAGYYQINGILRCSDTVGMTVQYASIFKNGAEYTRGIQDTTVDQVSVSDVVSCNGTDTIEIWGRVDGSSPSFNFSNANVCCVFSGFKIP